ncbi:MAG: TIGR02466 family protein [Pseudomonadota bacterium]
MSTTQSWFPTLIHHAPLVREGADALNAELLKEIQQLRQADAAGREWSKTSYPGGYTSYGSMDRLHQFSSTFMALEKKISLHVKQFAKANYWDLARGKLKMTDCWANVMPKGCAHSFHLHPQSVVSGTYYVATPPGCTGLKFEDPRLSSLMAAPLRAATAPREMQPFITVPAEAGTVILFESWLRHEVPPSTIEQERVSISFNYHLL